MEMKREYQDEIEEGGLVNFDEIGIEGLEIFVGVAILGRGDVFVAVLDDFG